MASRLHRLRLSVTACFLVALALGLLVYAGMGKDEADAKTSDLSLEVRKRVQPRLEREAAAVDLRLGAPVFMRVFKESHELEVWLETEPGGPYTRFRTYRIATWGQGTLGPKLKEGDGQAPEGFYSVGPERLNPKSRFHLSFNIGYPNAFDRSLGRTGSLIMVHGGKVSIGCIAVTDEKIEEIYMIAEAALERGQAAFPIHLFPFRPSDERLARETASPWHDFWLNLREGHDLFESTRRPPVVRAEAGRYVFEAEAPARPGGEERANPHDK